MTFQKGLKYNKTYSCAVCKSPQRKTIERLWKDRNNIRKEIWEKYKPAIAGVSSYESFSHIMHTHMRDKHAEQNEVVIALQKDSGILGKEVTIESFAQKMLELGQIKINNMTPGEIKLKDVIAAQKLLLDKQKISLSEDMMAIKMAELFGGVAVPVKAETITDAEILGYTKEEK